MGGISDELRKNICLRMEGEKIGELYKWIPKTQEFCNKFKEIACNPSEKQRIENYHNTINENIGSLYSLMIKTYKNISSDNKLPNELKEIIENHSEDFDEFEVLEGLSIALYCTIRIYLIDSKKITNFGKTTLFNSPISILIYGDAYYCLYPFWYCKYIPDTIKSKKAISERTKVMEEEKALRATCKLIIEHNIKVSKMLEAYSNVHIDKKNSEKAKKMNDRENTGLHKNDDKDDDEDNSDIEDNAAKKKSKKEESEDENMHPKDNEIITEINEMKEKILRHIEELKEHIGSNLSGKWEELGRLVAPSKEQFCYICNRNKGTIENTCYHYICTSCLIS